MTKFLKKDIGRRVQIVYDLEKFPKPKKRKNYIDTINLTKKLGAGMFDEGKILNVTKEYVDIQREHPLLNFYINIGGRLNKHNDDNFPFGRKNPEFKRVPYDLIKEYKFL